MTTLRFVTSLTALALTAAPALGETIEFDFAGAAGPGLTPGNEVGPNTPVSTGLESDAFGGEFGPGLVLDTDANTLDFAFAYSQLSGGLFDAASGIHLHLVPDDAEDPFAATGPIVFNLNSFDDSNVTLTNSPNPIGDVSGAVTGTLNFDDEQEADFLAGRYYLNIHSAGFTGGELRGNLVPVGGIIVAGGDDNTGGNGPNAVPTPGAAAAGLGLMGLLAARRRRQG